MERSLCGDSRAPSNDWLSDLEQRRLLATARAPQERFIISVLRWTGVRVGEAVSLRVGDVDPWVDRGSIRVRRSKTNAGIRTIPIIPALRPELVRWYEHLREQRSRPLG